MARLKLLNNGIAECIKTGSRYYQDVSTGRWKLTPFPAVDDLARHRATKLGIDIDASYRSFDIELRVNPPAQLIRDLARAPIMSMEKVDSLHSGALYVGGWKERKGRRRAS